MYSLAVLLLCNRLPKEGLALLHKMKSLIPAESDAVSGLSGNQFFLNVVRSNTYVVNELKMFSSCTAKVHQNLELMSIEFLIESRDFAKALAEIEAFEAKASSKVSLVVRELCLEEEDDSGEMACLT
jgi:hypothetical protein